MLKGDIVTLRAPCDADFPFFVALRNDIDVQYALLAVPRPNSPERVREWLNNRLADPTGVFFVIAENSSDAPVGFVQLTRMDYVHRRGELGICVDQRYHGRGLAAEALALLEQYVVDTFELRKIVLYVLSSNTRAASFYRREGFAEVGTHKVHHYQRGVYHDVVVMEKLLAVQRATGGERTAG